MLNNMNCDFFFLSVGWASPHRKAVCVSWSNLQNKRDFCWPSKWVANSSQRIVCQLSRFVTGVSGPTYGLNPWPPNPISYVVPARLFNGHYTWVNNLDKKIEWFWGLKIQRNQNPALKVSLGLQLPHNFILKWCLSHSTFVLPWQQTLILHPRDWARKAGEYGTNPLCVS